MKKKEEISAMLRRARKLNPETFDAILADYQKNGESALNAIKPLGAPKKVQRVNLALLLADVMNAIDAGISQRAKLKALANKGVAWGDGNIQRKWYNESTIKTHLQKARKRYKEDPIFCADVEFYRWCFSVLNL